MQSGELIVAAMPSKNAYTRTNARKYGGGNTIFRSALVYLSFIAIGMLIYSLLRPALNTLFCRLIADFASIPKIEIYDLPKTISRFFAFVREEAVFLALVAAASVSYFCGPLCNTLLLLRGFRVGFAFGQAVVLFRAATWPPLMFSCFLVKEAVFSAILVYAVTRSRFASHGMRIAVDRSLGASCGIFISLLLYLLVCLLGLLCTAILFSFIL